MVSSTRAPLRGMLQQFLRYSLVGLLSNAVVYLLYLLVVAHGMMPRHAIAVSYSCGACIGFFANRHWTFAYHGNVASTGIRYVVAHICGYALNLALIWIFHEQIGLPHQWVQGGAIIVVAVFLFLAFRYAVFPAHAGVSGR